MAEVKRTTLSAPQPARVGQAQPRKAEALVKSVAVPSGWRTPMGQAARPRSDGFEVKGANQPTTAIAAGAAPSTKPVDLEATVTRLGGLPDAQRASVLARLQSLKGPDLQPELKLLEAVDRSSIADRGFATDFELRALASQDPRVAAQLTPEVRAALVRGVSDSRDESDRGVGGVLGRHQATQALKALAKMPAGTAAAIHNLLGAAGAGGGKKGDAPAEQALILKAVAARSDSLTGPAADAALAELKQYAGAIRGSPRAELMRTSTVLDLSDANTSKFNPSQPGVVDENGDNDGLYQRYESSCGPAVAQMMRAEADPIYARSLHLAGLHDASEKGPLSTEQRTTLERPRAGLQTAAGDTVKLSAAQAESYRKTSKLPDGIFVTHGEAVPRTEYRTRIETLKAQTTRAGFKPQQLRLIEADIGNRPPASAQEAAARKDAWAALRKANKGLPTEADVQTLRNGVRLGIGMQLEAAVDDIARPATHASVRPHPFSADAVEQQLSGGKTVPLFISDAQGGNGHFLLMSNVQGAAPDRRFLISDPASGKTSWLPEQDLADPSGAWANFQFGLPAAAARLSYTG